jgi:sulfatase maturation enzyme AslB (radical SAM superfamily)
LLIVNGIEFCQDFKEEKMEITNLTFILTDACNFNCTYCIQKKEQKRIDKATIDTAVDFFYPFLKNDNKVHIGFYGGEPLLEYEQIKHTVLLVEEKNKTDDKNIKFILTTNGSLLTDEKLEFFNRSKFTLLLSFDGLAQDIGRAKGTREKLVRVMKRIREYPDIDFEINSVFTPQTMPMFFDSLRYMIELDGTEISFSLSSMENWKPRDMAVINEQLDLLVDYLVSYYSEKGIIPVKSFRSPVAGAGLFRCSAGSNRMAVTPEGNVWGCFMFHDYFKTRIGDPQYRDYSYGSLNDFIANYKTRYPEITANHSDLHQDMFQVEKNFCFLCENVGACAVCPVNAAYTTGSLGKISCRQCQLNKLQLKARRDFHQQLQ